MFAALESLEILPMEDDARSSVETRQGSGQGMTISSFNGLENDILSLLNEGGALPQPTSSTIEADQRTRMNLDGFEWDLCSFFNGDDCQLSGSLASEFINDAQQQQQQQQSNMDEFEWDLFSLMAGDESPLQGTLASESNINDAQQLHEDGSVWDLFFTLEGDGFPLQEPLASESQNDAQQQQNENGFVWDPFSALEDDGSPSQKSLPSGSSTCEAMQQEQQQRQQQQKYSDEEDPDDNKEEERDNMHSARSSSKNFFSERNRRKRLNQQLFTLRSIVPNITKMDKRSILVDALAYLQSILEETEREIKEKRGLAPENSFVLEPEIPPVQPQQHVPCASPPSISEIDVEKVDEDRFVLKISCNRVIGAPSLVQRVIESLGLEVTCTSINEHGQLHMQTTAFLHVKKKRVVTNEMLLHRVGSVATKFGLLPHI